MNQLTHVDLIQRGISSNLHPVSGRSGKLYGTAVHTPKDGGVTYRMSFKDYLDTAHDICGNTAPGQQWVPIFIDAGDKPVRPKCDRCHKPSVAMWDRFPYCAADAPANATWYDEVERAEWLKSKDSAVTPPPPAEMPDVQPRIDEKLTAGVTDTDGQLPAETMRPPIMGTAGENEEVESDDIPAALRVPKPAPAPGAAAQPPPAVASEKVEPVAQSSAERPPAATTAPAPAKAVAVVAAITEGVIKAVVPQLEKLVADRIDALKLELGPRPGSPPPAARKRTNHRKKPATDHPEKAPSAFQALQRKGKELGINLFGKGKEALEAEIAKVEKKGSGRK